MSERSDNVVRLGCAEQAAIADELCRYWQHVVDEGVPEHLRGVVLRFAASDKAEVGAAAAQASQAEGESGIVLLADFRRGDCENPA
jgi:hypothetical protein